MKITKHPYSAVLGWSYSRQATFETCLRKYHFMYYNKGEDIKKLKKSTTKALLVGNFAHDEIALLLESYFEHGSFPSVTAASVGISSRAAKYARVPVLPGAVVTMDEVVDEVTEMVTFWLTNVAPLIASYRYVDYIIETPFYGETRLDGMKAYIKVDFALLDGEGVVRIFDWKTGSMDYTSNAQLATYALWASKTFGVPAENVRASFVSLKSDDIRTFTFTEEELQAVMTRIIKSTTAMYAYLEDVPSNRPLPVEVFAPLRLGDPTCNFCPFDSICIRKD